MSGKFPMMFMVPSPLLGRVEDVLPDKVTQSSNEWTQLSSHILKQKREATAKGQWKAPYPITDEAFRDLHPFGAQYCPALQEVHDIGFVIKWPATAIIRKVTDKGWLLKPSTNFNFYKYHEQVTFREAGEAEAISIDTGWSFVTPPGWNILVKGIPNNLSGLPGGLQLAEGIIRSDQAVIGLQVHAKIPKHAPEEIKIKRGDPMMLVFPFQREEIGLGVMTDEGSVKAAESLVKKLSSSADRKPGLYKQLYIEDFNPTPFYEQLHATWQAEHPGHGDADDDADE